MSFPFAQKLIVCSTFCAVSVCQLRQLGGALHQEGVPRSVANAAVFTKPGPAWGVLTENEPRLTFQCLLRFTYL